MSGGPVVRLYGAARAVFRAVRPAAAAVKHGVSSALRSGVDGPIRLVLRGGWALVTGTAAAAHRGGGVPALVFRPAPGSDAPSDFVRVLAGVAAERRDAGRPAPTAIVLHLPDDVPGGPLRSLAVLAGEEVDVHVVWSDAVAADTIAAEQLSPSEDRPVDDLEPGRGLLPVPVLWYNAAREWLKSRDAARCVVAVSTAGLAPERADDLLRAVAADLSGAMFVVLDSAAPSGVVDAAAGGLDFMTRIAAAAAADAYLGGNGVYGAIAVDAGVPSVLISRRDGIPAVDLVREAADAAAGSTRIA